jgi:hypothetical protein
MSNGRTYLSLPADLTLPFFSYGLFKPGELPYRQIEEFGDPRPALRLFQQPGKASSSTTSIRAGSGSWPSSRARTSCGPATGPGRASPTMPPPMHWFCPSTATSPGSPKQICEPNVRAAGPSGVHGIRCRHDCGPRLKAGRSSRLPNQSGSSPSSRRTTPGSSALETLHSRGPDPEQRLAMHAVYAQEYDIVGAGRVREDAERIGRTDRAATGEIGAAVPSNRTTT